MSGVLNRLAASSLLLFGFCSSTTVLAAPVHSAFEEGANAHDQPKAHVHGKAEMQVNIQNNVLVVDLKIPAMDVLGFEHEPETAEERQRVKTTLTYLKQVNQWIGLVDTAGCMVESSKAKSPYDLAGNHEHEHDHHHSHDDFSVSAKWNCAKPAALTHIQVNLFSQLSRVQAINLNWITNETAGIATLTPTAKRIELVTPK